VERLLEGSETAGEFSNGVLLFIPQSEIRNPKW